MNSIFLQTVHAITINNIINKEIIRQKKATEIDSCNVNPCNIATNLFNTEFSSCNTALGSCNVNSIEFTSSSHLKKGTALDS